MLRRRGTGDVQTWHSDDGLPSDAVIALAQTPDGYLWVGTNAGLARFDGVAFTVFPETQVLEGIASGLSNKEIGDDLGISEATVKSHVNAILAKLEAKDRTDAAMIALKRGLIG